MTLLTIFVGIIAFSNLVLLVGLAYLAFAVRGLVNKQVQPAVHEVTSTLKDVHEFIDRVEDRAEEVMSIGEDTARKVSGKVVATSDVIQHAVSEPLINFTSIVAGIARAVSAYRQASTRQ